MPDNKKLKGKQDRIRVAAADPSEVEYLHRTFHMLSHQAISGAIRTAGPMRKNIVKYIKAKHRFVLGCYGIK
ncbi:DUF3606 domain-containing protein [Ferruginibacter sp. HRS2-29]|uniref:DUF3606 domain-containing protein n=1 Tax=Ferruginibacter sp. HRS2-29 TaxID=2487334 RepID=UPI0020CE98B5|nr:DUF3606 domain-containing protein [Ferruginibacter sp. HRS2-29]MCP9749489.1 DUF3606 domain-containing protein [Ferruginibacter sp. HRS2-29]